MNEILKNPRLVWTYLKGGVIDSNFEVQIIKSVKNCGLEFLGAISYTHANILGSVNTVVEFHGGGAGENQ